MSISYTIVTLRSERLIYINIPYGYINGEKNTLIGFIARNKSKYDGKLRWKKCNKT